MRKRTASVSRSVTDSYFGPNLRGFSRSDASLSPSAA
jgi:hypothetical protein